MENKKSLRLTRAWTREGQYGSFSVGTVKLSDLNEVLAALGNPDVFELVISPAEKKTEKSPDYNINLRPKLTKVVGGTQASRVPGGDRTVGNSDRKRRF